MSSESIYKIKVRNGDFEIELQGDKEWVEVKYKELKKEIKPITQVSTPITSKGEQKELPMTLSEFIRGKSNLSSNSDEMAVFAYWLYHKEKMSSITLKDIRNCYSDTRMTVPDNPSQYLGDLQKKGLLKKMEEKKEGMNAYTITPTGESYVKNEL